MARYYVNKNTDHQGNHEVHIETCNWLPQAENRIDLGLHSDCHSAVRKAKRDHYATSDGCRHCSSECHTG